MAYNKKSKKDFGPKKDPYEEQTKKVIEALKNGTVPWHRTWDRFNDTPINLVGKYEYHGMNLFLLLMVAQISGYSCRYWVTFNQAKKMGGHVNQDEKGLPIILWKPIEKPVIKDGVDTGEKKIVRFCQLSYVFNALHQCTGLEDKIPQEVKTVREFTPIQAADNIFNGMPTRPEVQHGFTKASYNRSFDHVKMPNPELFHKKEEYYCTLFHELAHSTGHSSRLNRFSNNDPMVFGNSEYSKEELVAELTSIFLCSESGIDDIIFDNSAGYIAGWLNKLESDNKFVFSAASKAKKAARFILGENVAKPSSTDASEESDAIETAEIDVAVGE